MLQCYLPRFSYCFQTVDMREREGCTCTRSWNRGLAELNSAAVRMKEDVRFLCGMLRRSVSLDYLVNGERDGLFRVLDVP